MQERESRGGIPGQMLGGDPDAGAFLSKDRDAATVAQAPTRNLPFEVALRALKDGRRAKREGWGGGNFVVMMPELRLPPYNTQGTERKVNDRTAKWIGEDKPLNCQPYLAIYFEAGNEWQPGWTPLMGDIFATDWTIL